MVSELAYTALKQQKQRNRVPVSCLICKRRKVKCDKLKPACSGCVRNGVPHLCEYVEPSWTNNDETKKQSLNRTKPTTQVEQLDDYRKLKSQKDKIINEQRKEIEDLKRQLAVSQQLSPKFKSVEQDQAVNILGKLNINNTSTKTTLEVKNDSAYLIKPNSLEHKQNHVDIYSWISIIKLDPQLTTLWYKITNLQKIYHLYKMNLINSKAKGEISNTTSITMDPLSKKSSYRINEIDFTHSVVPGVKSSSSHLKCPVVECDFNFMADASPTPVPTSQGGDVMNLEKNCLFQRESDHVSNIDKHEEVSENSENLLKKLQNIWNSTLCLLRGNGIMNYNQTEFLINFYFNSTTRNAESRKLLCFYKSEIEDLITKDDDAISLNFSTGLAQNDEDRYFNLSLKGVYLCMFSLIIEESLDIIRLQADLNDNNSLRVEFQTLFPSEILYIGLGYKATNIFLIVEEYLLHISNEKKFNERILKCLVYISCCTAFLNREVLNYEKQGALSDSKAGFQTIFTQLIKYIFAEKGYLEVWKSPQDITLKYNEFEQINKEFRINMCYLWSDLIRLVNLVTFNVTPLVTHLEKLGRLISKFYEKIEGCDACNDHVKFLHDHGSIQENELITTFNINFLISRIYYNLKRGVERVGETKLTTKLLLKMIGECKSWKNSDILSNSRKTRISETKCILHYLSFHLSYIIILQEEEKEEELGISFNKSYPGVFSEFCDLILFIHTIIKGETRGSDSQYLLIFVTELLTRIIHFMIGLLLRLANNGNVTDPLVLLNLVSLVNIKLLVDGMKPQNTDPRQTLNDIIVNVMNKTITSLTNSYIMDKEKVIKLSKLWNFYLTFIKNSHKLSSLDYAKMHANIPGFKSANSQTMTRCPVASKSEKANGSKQCPMKQEITTSGTNLGFARCPISHITTPMDVDNVRAAPPNLEKCPIDHKSLTNTQESKKRKFPLDDPSLQNRGISSNGYNPVESNLRSNNETTNKRSPNLRSKENTLSTINSDNSKIPDFDSVTMNNSIIDNVSNSLTSFESDIIVSEMGKSSTADEEFPNFGVDWQEFTDFDFDFLQNELIFKQVQNKDVNNSSIEDLFR